MRTLMARPFLAGILALCVVLGGCITSPSAPTRFYMLNALDQPAPSSSDDRDRVLISLGPVRVPEYLNRPQIVTHLDRSEYHLDEFSRWMEPLGDNITRVMAENLTILLSADAIEILSIPRAVATGYTIGIQLLRMDGRLGGAVTAVFRWTVFGADDELLMTKRSVFRDTASDKTYRGFLAAQNRIVETLSRNVASDIRLVVGARAGH